MVRFSGKEIAESYFSDLRILIVFIFWIPKIVRLTFSEAACHRRENQTRHEDDSNEKLLGSQKVS